MPFTPLVSTPPDSWAYVIGGSRGVPPAAVRAQARRLSLAGATPALILDPREAVKVANDLYSRVGSVRYAGKAGPFACVVEALAIEGHGFDVASVELGFGGGGDGAEDSVEGIADVFEFVVERVAAMLEPVLETFEQISRKIGAVAGGIAVGADGIEALDDQRLVAGRRAGQPAAIAPTRRPGGSGPAGPWHKIAAGSLRAILGRRPAVRLGYSWADGRGPRSGQPRQRIEGGVEIGG